MQRLRTAPPVQVALLRQWRKNPSGPGRTTLGCEVTFPEPGRHFAPPASSDLALITEHCKPALVLLAFAFTAYSLHCAHAFARIPSPRALTDDSHNGGLTEVGSSALAPPSASVADCQPATFRDNAHSQGRDLAAENALGGILRGHTPRSDPVPFQPQTRRASKHGRPQRAATEQKA